MMNTLTQATADLTAALHHVDGVKVTTDASDLSALPVLVISPPRLEWTSGRLEPTDATYTVWAVIDQDERAVERLSVIALAVAVAVDIMPNGAVVRAAPGAFPAAAGSQLPCYEIDVEVGL